MITLKSPAQGEKISLLTDVQIKFLESDRSGVDIENFDYLGLKKHYKEEFSIPRSVEFWWKADGESTLHLSESDSFESYISESGNGHCEMCNLKCATRYYWRVVCGDETSGTFYFDTTDICPRMIAIDGLTNSRDCGGWKTFSGKRIKQELLYRGGELNSHMAITSKGLETMRKTLKIKTVIDLRGETEEVENIYGGNYINVPVRPYESWFETPEYTRRIFDVLSDTKNYPVYFHCWGGADRTGTLSFLIGALLGMEYSDLVDDYEMTTLSMWGVRSRNSDWFKGFHKTFFALEGETVSEKAENHLLSCGITKEQIENFRKIMLE